MPFKTENNYEHHRPVLVYQEANIISFFDSVVQYK